jgi:hypothetical protein
MSEHTAEPLTHWEQRQLVLIHDIALALSKSEWDSLRWHFEQVWDEGYRRAALDRYEALFDPSGPSRNPYRPALDGSA